MKISIVIPAFNEERLVGETLQHVTRAAAAITQAGCEHELIVCDNNSTDRTAEIARAAGATVVFEPMNQIGRARNCGAAAATGDWSLFIDADSQPSPELLAEVVAAIRTGRCIAGGSTVRLDVGSIPAQTVTRLWNLASRTLRLLAGSFIFCETAAFRKIGGFDNQYFAAEEIDLARRLKIHARGSGRKIVILHRHPMLTSARKVQLYSWTEHLRFVFRAVFFHRKTVRDREACHAWYDGRR